MSPTTRRRTLPRRGALLEEIARSDVTFSEQDGRWTGKCLICNGWLSFDPRRPEGVSIEHIVPRTRGGTNDLANLARAHPSCNGEKGRNWDNRRGRRGRSEEYDRLIERLQRERVRRRRNQDAD